jgi:chorismate-pyruvate lyase
MSLERRLFPHDAAHAPLLRALLSLDGSTTRLCEALAGGPVQVLIHQQRRTADVPEAVREALGGTRWVERVTSLCAGREVMMDNLSYTCVDTAPGWFTQGLEEGAVPIGHLLQRLFVWREGLNQHALRVLPLLWAHVGQPDERASRAYRIVTPEGPLMLLAEAFRGGMVRVEKNRSE